METNISYLCIVINNNKIMVKKDKIVFNFLLIGAFLYREGNRILNEFGLNQQQFVVLKYISSRQPINQKEIHSHLLFEKSNLSKIIKKLENLELIKKTPGLNDSRYSLLTIKQKGKIIVKKAIKKIEIYNTELLENFSGKEIIKLNNTLEIFINKIRRQ